MKLMVMTFVLISLWDFSPLYAKAKSTGKASYTAHCVRKTSKHRALDASKRFCACMVQSMEKKLNDEDFAKLSQLKDADPDIKKATQVSQVNETEATLGIYEFEIAEQCVQHLKAKKK